MPIRLRHNLGAAYSPLYFLAALGLGGLAVSFFMWLMFWVPHPGKPVPTFEDIAAVLQAGEPAPVAMVISSDLRILTERATVAAASARASAGAGASALAAISVFAALVIAIICVIVPVFALVPAVFIVFLSWRRRRQADRKHAGLRVLR